MQQRCDGSTNTMALGETYGTPLVMINEPKLEYPKPSGTEQMTVVSNAIGWIACMVDQDFLGDEEQTAGCREAFLASNVPSARRYFIKLIDARLQAVLSRNMYSEHWVARIDTAAVWASVPLVDRGIVLDARVTAVPRTICHSIEECRDAW